MLKNDLVDYGDKMMRGVSECRCD